MPTNTAQPVAGSALIDALLQPTADTWQHAAMIVGLFAIFRLISAVLEYMREKCCSALKERQRVAASDAEEAAALALQERSVLEEQRILRTLWKDLSPADKDLVKKDDVYWMIRRWGYTVRSALVWICLRLLLAHKLPIAIAFYLLWTVPSIQGWGMAAKIINAYHCVVYFLGLLGSIILSLSLPGSSARMEIVRYLLIPSTAGMNANQQFGQLWDAAAACEKAPLWHVVKLFGVNCLLPERLTSILAGVSFLRNFGEGCQHVCIPCVVIVITVEPFVSAVLWSWRMYTTPDFWTCMALWSAAHGILGAVGLSTMAVVTDNRSEKDLIFFED